LLKRHLEFKLKLELEPTASTSKTNVKKVMIREVREIYI
jgi:hypothetical protein